MKTRYRISPEGRGKELSDEEIASYRNADKLLYNYHKVTQRPKKPLYKDPKAFLFLLLIVLLAYLLTEVVVKRGSEDLEPGVELMD